MFIDVRLRGNQRMLVNTDAIIKCDLQMKDNSEDWELVIKFKDSTTTLSDPNRAPLFQVYERIRRLTQEQ